jgi:hypothetical protein
MKINNLWNLTGITCLAFGIYSILVASVIIAYETAAFSILFALFFIAFGIIYLIAGVSFLKKGKYGTFIFFGMFGSTFWWSSGLPWYIWPMIVMPIVILVLFILVFVLSQINKES